MSLSPTLTPRIASPFVGREVELELLKEAHGSARAGGSTARRLALVTGGAGLGKSVLVHELTTYLRARGERFLEGRCYPGLEQAYQPFGELVMQALTSLEQLGVDAASASRYVSRLEALLPARRAATPVTSKWQLYDALLEFLQELGRLAPHTLFIHDVHYADPASLDLLRFLAENLASPEALESPEHPGYPGLLVVTSREADGDAGDGGADEAGGAAGDGAVPNDGTASDSAALSSINCRSR